jgi:type VI secretion system protein ImpJ
MAPEQQSVDVYLALPLALEGRPNVLGEGADAGSIARYRSRNTELCDGVSGGGRKAIELGAAEYALRFGDESLDNYTALRVARLRRQPDGKVIVDRTDIPAVLWIGASSILIEQLGALVQSILARVANLAAARKQGGDGSARFGERDGNVSRMSHILNAHAPMLMQHLEAGTVHPYELYRDLAMLCGALCAFSAGSGPADVPRYDHDELGKVFAALMDMIRSVVATDFETACVRLPVTEVGPAVYACDVPGEQVLDAGKVFLGVSAGMPTRELVVRVLQGIKVSSRDRLELLVSSALPGLRLMHVPNPPESLPTRPSYVYFALDKHNGLWDGVRTSGALAMYLPGEYPALDIEVLVLRDH